MLSLSRYDRIVIPPFYQWIKNRQIVYPFSNAQKECLILEKKQKKNKIELNLKSFFQNKISLK